MDNKRIILWGAAGALLWLNVMTWQHDYPPVAVVAAVESAANVSIDSSLPSLPNSASSAPNVSGAIEPPNSAVAIGATTGAKIHVVTDVLDLDVNVRGGDIERADLLKYSLSKDQPNVPVRLLSDQANDKFVVHSGLLAADPTMAPTHEAVFSSAATSYQLQNDQNELSVDLKWSSPQGITVTKTLVFHRGSYAIDVRYTVNNASSTEWQAASYVALFRHDLPVSRSMFNAETMSYRGPAVYDGKTYQKIDLKSDKEKNFKASFSGGWLAALQHHFVVAAVPMLGASYEYTISPDNNNDFSMTTRGPLLTVASGQSISIAEKLYVGPKLQDQLEAVGPKLQLVSDYGRLTLIAQPLFWLLQFVHRGISNWGVDIIIVTLLIKAAFYWLTASSGRSMAKMRTLAPRIKAIQERFKDDREQLGRATMELYKKEKINPIAGCLPMLIQMPFFMGFYWVLLESAEMHQAPFVGWITDLSARDPYFILPVLMGVANFAQFKMNPPPPDPTQAQIMAFMPIVMTVMMAWFPAGLVLYWITNTITSALQQWRINQLVAADTQKQNA